MIPCCFLLSTGSSSFLSKTHNHLSPRMISSKINLSPHKIPEYEAFTDFSDNKLRDVKACREYKELYKPITPKESTIRSLQPMKRQWDVFWSQAIQIDGSQARRHILMVSNFKKAIVALKDYCQKNNLKKDIHQLYAQLLNQYYGDNFNEKDMQYLENLMFYTLHNLKFNIFIGNRHWNGGINDTLSCIKNTEDSLLTSIKESKTMKELKRHISNWQNKGILIKKEYKDDNYKNIRIEIQDMILSMTSFDVSHLSLDIVKKDLTERIQSIIDSLALDLSQAKNDNVRKWQNSVFPKLHSNLAELIEKPSLDKAETIFRDILKTNENGAHCLGINLCELEKDETGTIHFFQNAITSN